MKSITPSLAVADIGASMRFYTDVLGFESEFSMPGPDGQIVHGSVGRGGHSIMFGLRQESEPYERDPLGQGVVLYATVDDDEDIDDYFARVKGAGATIVQEPTDQFWGHRDWGVSDPDGYRIYISKETRRVSEDEMREAMLAGSPAD
jgi:PhnB protein